MSNWPIGAFDKVSLVKWAKIGYFGLFDKVFLVKWPILAKSCFPGFRRFPEAWNTLLSRRRVRRVSMQDAGNLRRRSPAKVALGFACPVHPGKPTKPSAVADARGSATGFTWASATEAYCGSMRSFPPLPPSYRSWLPGAIWGH